MSNQTQILTLFLHTPFGIFNKNAVAYVRVDEQGNAVVFVNGVNEPIVLNADEASKLIKALTPMASMR
jgi:hypothetical protein